MPGLRGEAAIVGFVELPAERSLSGPPRFTLEQWAMLARSALADAGISPREVDGLVTGSLAESQYFVPATLAEYLGMSANFGELVDLGGATAAAAVWRAAAAVELGLCEVVLVVMPGSWAMPRSPDFAVRADPWLGSSSGLYGSPQAEFDIPYGNVGQNAPYAQIATLYGHLYGYDPAAMAKISVDQRTNACATPGAVFHDKPITIDDVLASPMVADPLRRLEIVMPCHGGAGVVIANADVANRSRHRPVWISGFGERLTHKTPTYADDMLQSPLKVAAEQAFSMAGVTRSEVDMASIYDCYTITVLLSLEDAGFCAKGAGAEFIRTRDLTFRGDFPLNTAGGQLGYGQAGLAGGMHHVCDGVRQVMGRSGDAQVDNCDVAFVSGNGGLMSEQVALILKGGLMRYVDGMPMPVPTPVSEPYWRSLREHRIQIQYSPSTDSWVFYPRILAPGSLADDLEWREISGRGTLHAYTLATRPTGPPWQNSLPQHLAIVQWDEGPRVSTELVDALGRDVRIGMVVEPVFVDIPDAAVTLLRYRPIN